VGGGGGGGGLDDIEPDIFRAAGGGREAWREIVLLLSKFGEEVTRIALLEPPPNIGGGPRELPLLRDVLLFLGGADWRAGIGAFFGGPLWYIPPPPPLLPPPIPLPLPPARDPPSAFSDVIGELLSLIWVLFSFFNFFPFCIWSSRAERDMFGEERNDYFQANSVSLKNQGIFSSKNKKVDFHEKDPNASKFNAFAKKAITNIVHEEE